jgi:hypothetical protein
VTRLLTFLACAAVVAACGGGGGEQPSPEQIAGAPGAPSAILPASGAVSGWERAGETGVFPGADLYGHINGGAEVFLELGFDRLEVQRYASGDDELSVELYHMADPEAALGIYLMKCGDETPDPAIDARHTVSDLQVHLVKGTVYATVSNLSGADGAAAALVPFAAEMAASIEPAPAAGVLAVLPEDDLIPGSERIVRGPFTLGALYTLGDGDVLRLGETGATAVAAQYGAEDAPVTRIVARYDDSATARSAFEHVVANLDSYLEPVQEGDQRLVFKDYADQYGVVTLDGSTHDVQVHLPEPPAEP